MSVAAAERHHLISGAGRFREMQAASASAELSLSLLQVSKLPLGGGSPLGGLTPLRGLIIIN